MWAIQLDVDLSSKYQLETQLNDQSTSVTLSDAIVLFKQFT